MEHFTLPHLTAIVITVLVALGAALLPRRIPALRSDLVARLGAAALAATWLWLQVRAIRDEFEPASDLPFQLSDWAVMITVVALVTLRPLVVELTWFWGLAGAIWAVLTPDTSRGFESVNTWAFFIAHSGVIVAACYLVLGRGMQPRPGAAWRAIGFSLVVFMIAGVADLITGGNYMYLREPPSRGSLLDLMGPWPWYLLSATALALVLFAALEAPFRTSPRELLRPPRRSPTAP